MIVGGFSVKQLKVAIWAKYKGIEVGVISDLSNEMKHSYIKGVGVYYISNAKQRI